MADMLQTVHWSLGADGHRRGDMWLREGRESLEDVLRESIRRLGLELQMRSAFEVTQPLWYGLWIGTPLTATQCGLLREVLMEAARLVPRYGEHIKDFTQALADSARTGEPLHVELTRPGHVDFGWITTFVHCPRCKAEGPVEPWQESYSKESLECPVCGHSYVPAATYSSERELFAETVRCRSCQAEHRVRDFPDDEIQTLEDRHRLEAYTEEMNWLSRVEEFYKRHPDLEGEIKPHFKMVLESLDPEVQEAMFARTPFDEIKLPSGGVANLDRSQAWSMDDREVIEYLHHHYFSLPGRMKFVEESIQGLGLQLSNGTPVMCTRCGGQLS